MTYCAICFVNGDLRPAKEPWEGFPTCGRCQTEAKVKARWFKSDVLKLPDWSKLSPEEAVLVRHGARRIFAGNSAGVLMPEKV
jgi:hypothetical protein